MAGFEQITTRDRSSGRFHKRYIINGRTVVDERCNLDQAGAYDVMPQVSRASRGDGVPIGTDPALLCKFCFGDTEADDSVG
jgi:hypothetical protein